MEADQPRPKANANLRKLTRDALRANARAESAKGRARLPKKKVKEARQAWKLARDQYRAARKQAKKAEEELRTIQKVLQARVDKENEARKKRRRKSADSGPSAVPASSSVATNEAKSQAAPRV